MTEFDNMGIWNAVCESDPNTLKTVKQRGGFTAIDAQAQIMKATELWGPYGMSWGLRNCKWSAIPGENGIPSTICLDAEFFYPVLGATGADGSETWHGASFEISSDMPHDPRGECRKKLMTDVTTKALSKLGFNADVFLGQWNDNRYIQEMKKKSKVADFKDEKDARTANFMAAINKVGPTNQQLHRALGAEGYESLDEVTSSDARKALVRAIKEEVSKGGVEA